MLVYERIRPWPGSGRSGDCLPGLAVDAVLPPSELPPTDQLPGQRKVRMHTPHACVYVLRV